LAATAPAIPDRSLRPERRTMGRLRAVVAMTRPAQVALIVVIFLNGALLAMWRGTATTAELIAVWPVLLLVVVTSAAVHLANEAADHETDALTQRTPFSGGSGALQASGLSPRLPLLLSLAIAAIVVVVGVAVVARGAMPIAAGVLLLAGLGGGLAYSLPPVAAERRGWGEPLNAVLGALLLPLLGVAALAASIDVLDVAAFLPLFFVTFASVLATAWPDRAADAATGKRTIQVRLQPTLLRWIAFAAAVGFVAASVLSATAAAMPSAIAGLLVAPLLLVGLLRYTRGGSPIANVAAMVGLIVITTVVLVASLLFNWKPL
jgi:1,4-dihydroxy-2-naphthoate octaprenyltransferase